MTMILFFPLEFIRVFKNKDVEKVRSRQFQFNQKYISRSIKAICQRLIYDLKQDHIMWQRVSCFIEPAVIICQEKSKSAHRIWTLMEIEDNTSLNMPI